jgi:nicotinamide phosphoribosyltransferase
MIAINAKDVYKIGHKDQYPISTTEVYSNFTARSGKHSNVPESKGITFIGLQYLIMNYLIEEWNDSFFSKPKEQVVAKYQRRASKILNRYIDINHIEALHDLGYLPIVIKALPEGAFVPYGVPMLTIKNTLGDFFWLTNMLESVLSAELWQPITSATTYLGYKKIFYKYAELTCTPKEFIPYQGHDFSFRGMAGRHAAAISGFAVLGAGSIGTDCVPAIDIAEDYYLANAEDEAIGESVVATEHSCECSSIIEIVENKEVLQQFKDEYHARGIQLGLENEEVDDKVYAEYGYFKYLITEVYPDGIISIVSDSYDFWSVITKILPRLKSEILNRDGKVVIRPDSGDPVEILCGIDIPVVPAKYVAIDCLDSLKNYIQNDVESEIRNDTPHGEYGEDIVTRIYKAGDKYYKAKVEIEWNRHDKQYYYVDNSRVLKFEEVELSSEQKGLIECLWDIFGGTINDKGYKVLDSHIGAIYGDSITLNRAETILKNLSSNQFASGNIVLGIGSYSMQLVTRDTHGIAMKATNVVVNGKSIAIFKDPKTDDGTKKSAKGYMKVVEENGQYKLIDQVTFEEEQEGCLEKVFEDGRLVKQYSLAEIRQRTSL